MVSKLTIQALFSTVSQSLQHLISHNLLVRLRGKDSLKRSPKIFLVHLQFWLIWLVLLEKWCYTLSLQTLLQAHDLWTLLQAHGPQHIRLNNHKEPEQPPQKPNGRLNNSHKSKKIRIPSSCLLCSFTSHKDFKLTHKNKNKICTYPLYMHGYLHLQKK